MCLATALLAGLPSPGQAGEAYYLCVFGIQRPLLNRAKFTHTFGVFVKSSQPDGSPGPQALETITISWLPATLDIHMLQRDPEPGILLDLPGTLYWAYCNRARVTLWGPYQIDPELYRRAVVRARLLQSGTIRYTSIDGPFRPRAADCIHALSGVDVDPGLLRTRSAHGDIASWIVLQHLCRWLIQPHIEHDWLLEPLGLNQYCLVRRKLCDRPFALLPVLSAYYDPAPPQGTNVSGVEAPAPASWVSQPAEQGAGPDRMSNLRLKIADSRLGRTP
jgi:hypothetical protein